LVVGHKTQMRDGYDAVLLVYGLISGDDLKKPNRVFYEKNAISPRKGIKEFKVSNTEKFTVGLEIKSDIFVPGQFVDLHGTTIGKGFAGSMKRNNLGGGRASHGASVSHRAHGSTGGRQDPGKVFKNKKMAGHMGAVSNTIQNLKIVSVDSEKNLIIVKGSVPGYSGSFLTINNAVKKAL